MRLATDIRPVAWREAPWMWALLAIAGGLLVALFYDGLEVMVEWWSGNPEYSHGFALPFVAAFLVWQKKPLLERQRFDGSWTGFALMIGGIALYLAGQLSTLYVIVQYAFVVALLGLVLALMGWRSFRIVLVPLLILFFMVPLPVFLYQRLSGALQLVSSQLGVALIRMLDISVFLEGNVIDLGSYKLQVAEACSGLRYLFPLAALGFIAAYLFKGALWKRVVIFLSTVPITILMNSFRIGVTGALVEHRGIAMAEGFLHDFEGWVIFMACTAVLVAEMWLLARIGKDRRPLSQVFRLEMPPPVAADPMRSYRTIPAPFLAAVGVLAAAALASVALPSRVEASPARKSFYEFPLELGRWHGTPREFDPVQLAALKLDDYLLADFSAPEARPVNFYVAYYASQRKGESAHSPRSCIPGDGWEIVDLTQRPVTGASVAGHPLRVNRVLIERGNDKALVYYWFQQRGRVITNEYLVKWYLFWDALTRSRTDGALVRLVAYVGAGRSVEDADRELTAFAGRVAAPLEKYIPD